jgi:TolB protein
LTFVGVVGLSGRRARLERTDLFVVRADGSGLRRLTHLGTAEAPVWSPDGRTLVFSALRPTVCTPGGYALFEGPLFRVDSDGRHMRRLTHVRHLSCDGTSERSLAHKVRGEVDVPGSFSPDGAHLAFTRERLIGLYDERSIDVIRSDGAELRRLTANGGEPAYSPDGRQIAFDSNRDHNGEIRTGSDESEYANELYVMDTDGASPRRLTRTNELSEAAPSWSPDGSRIAYAAQAEGFTKTVRVINVTGTCGRVIAGDPRGDIWYAEPAWRPLIGRSGEGARSC